MSDSSKTDDHEIIKIIIEAVPHMSTFDKGYLLGKAEGIIERERELKAAQSA